MADLNRGTFYLHYKDVFDLLEKTEAELFEEFNSLVLSHDAPGPKAAPSLIFHEIFSLVYENADLVEILMGRKRGFEFHQPPSSIWSAKNACGTGWRSSAPGTLWSLRHTSPSLSPAVWAWCSTGSRAALRRHRSRWPFSRNRLFSRESMSWSAKNRLPIRRPAVYNRNTRPAASPDWLSRHVQGDSLCQKKIYIR